MLEEQKAVVSLKEIKRLIKEENKTRLEISKWLKEEFKLSPEQIKMVFNHPNIKNLRRGTKVQLILVDDINEEVEEAEIVEVENLEESESPIQPPIPPVEQETVLHSRMNQ